MLCFVDNVWFQKISILPPRRVTEILRGGGGGSKSVKLPKGRGVHVQKQFSFQRVSNAIERNTCLLSQILPINQTK